MAIYNRHQLLEAIQQAGLPFSDRLLTDWIQKGLIDRPHRKGLGRGKGTISWWPEEQLRLLLVLVRKRREVSRVATLANIPVGMWLYWGDRYVPLRQARRAMATWAQQHHMGSWSNAVRSADDLLSQIARPQATQAATLRLRRKLAVLAQGGSPNQEGLKAALLPVFDPTGAGRTVGPPGAVLSVEAVLQLLGARYHAISRLNGFSDSDYQTARLTHLAALTAYFQHQPDLATEVEIGGLFDRPDLRAMVSRACLDLLTHLGLIDQARQKPPGTRTIS